MKTSINLYINKQDTLEKITAFKNAGYDEFFTGMYDKTETLTWREQLDLAKELGLKCSMMHCSYYEPELNNFWLDNEIGEKVKNDYINQIKEYGEYTKDDLNKKNFVVHLNGDNNSITSEIGLKRINEILRVCEEYNVNLCIENLYSKTEIPYIFDNIKNPYLKICYDSGHKNFLTPDFDICEKYGKYITVLHLHENNGLKDEHKKLTATSNVFKKLIYEISLLNKDVVLCSEIKYAQEDWKDYIIENLKSLKQLNKEIEKNRDDLER